MKTRAAVLREMGLPRPYADSRPFSVEQIELAEPGPGEVLVEVAAAGICHSDLSVVNSAVPMPMPLVPGHEGAGVVAALGPGVEDLAVGDHVVMLFVASCGRCDFCANGRPNLCDPGRRANLQGTLLAGGTRITGEGGAMHHMLGVSCFAEHAVMARNSLLRIDKEVPLAEAALFGCAVVTGVGAVLNTAGVRAGATVAVVGLGGIGLNVLLAAKLAGARRLVAVDVKADKLALARQLGATDTFDATEDRIAHNIVKETGGVDYAFDASGVAPGIELAYMITRTGGTTVVASLLDREARLDLPAALLTLGERTLKGSFMGSAVPQRDIPAYLDLYRQGRLPVNRLMGDRVRLEDLNLAFDRLADGEAVRQIVVFD